MKPLVIYHDKCTDGFGAAFAAWLKLGDEAEYLPMNYGQDPKKLIDMATLPDRDVYVLDFSFPREDMEGLFSLANRVVWLDHHKTAFEMWCGGYEKGDIYKWHPSVPMGTMMDNHHITLDDNKSGAMLAWEFFHPDQDVPIFIAYIDDRDRWQWKLDGSAEFHAAMQTRQPWEFPFWKQLFLEDDGIGNFIEKGLEPLRIEGSAILGAQKQHVERIAKGAVKCEVPYDTRPATMPVARGLAVNTPIFESEVGSELATTGGSFGLAWYLAGNNRVRCSFRSNGDYDVSAIAAAYGGGGHRNAAGCEVSLETLMGWLK